MFAKQLLFFLFYILKLAVQLVSNDKNSKLEKNTRYRRLHIALLTFTREKEKET